MRLPRHNHRRASRDARYPDPFGAGDERLWDGGQWTGEVRASVGSGVAANGQRDERFPVSIETAVHEQLSVVSSPRKPGMHCQVLASRGRAGSISVFGGQMARLACAHGAWILKKSPTSGRGLTIESTDRKQAGKYLRRRLLPGGVIRLASGTEVELRRSRPGRWKLTSAHGRTCLAEVRRRRNRPTRGQELKVTVHSLPRDPTDASMIILAACALLMLPAGIE